MGFAGAGVAIMLRSEFGLEFEAFDGVRLEMDEGKVSMVEFEGNLEVVCEVGGRAGLRGIIKGVESGRE